MPEPITTRVLALEQWKEEIEKTLRWYGVQVSNMVERQEQLLESVKFLMKDKSGKKS